MFKFLSQLFGQPSAPQAQPDSFAHLDEVAPLRSAAAARSEPSFVCREPILDRNERIAGYEFLLSQHLSSHLAGKSAVVRRAYDDALIRNLGSAGVGSLLDHRLAFVGISPASFDNPRLSRLPADNTVLMVDPPANGNFAAEGLPDLLAAARARGFRIGYRLQPQGGADSLLQRCDFIQISTPAYDGLQIADWVRRLRKLSSPTGGAAALIAADIETSDDFQVCFRAGFDYFHGPFIIRREDWHPPRSQIDRSRVIQVLNQLRSGTDGTELANTIRQDAVLTYKLLRYINSAANGLQREVTALDQGLLLLGRERFYRWLSLLLFDVQQAGYAERVLIEQALVRANLMERLGKRAARGSVDPDLLFLTGLFSLLDQLLGRPIAEVLAGVSVPQTVAQALLTADGPLAPFLALAMACEAGDEEEIARQAKACGLDAASVNQDLLAALVWANEVGELSG